MPGLFVAPFPYFAQGHVLWLVFASLLAGALNAMAGGGSFLSFPAMLGMGIAPIEANATNTVALWPGQLTSLATLRGDVRRDLMPVVLITSIVGGVLGAEILLHTQQRTFLHLIPWLLLLGATLFGISGPVSRWLRTRASGPEQQDRRIARGPLALGLLPVCVYVGYFGAGSGFLVMTVLSLFGLEQMRQLNALKVLSVGASNLCAVLAFILAGRVVWHDCLLAMIFAAVGGYLGARNARRMNPSALRAAVVVTGIAISAYFFWSERA